MKITSNGSRKPRRHNTKKICTKQSSEKTQCTHPVESEIVLNQSNSKFIRADPLTQQQLVVVLTEMSRHLLMLLRQETDCTLPISAATSEKHKHQTRISRKNADSSGS